METEKLNKKNMYDLIIRKDAIECLPICTTMTPALFSLMYEIPAVETVPMQNWEDLKKIIVKMAEKAGNTDVKRVLMYLGVIMGLLENGQGEKNRLIREYIDGATGSYEVSK